VTLFGFAQKLGQRGDVRAESAARKPRRYFLKEPAVAVRIIERGEREIRAALWVAPGHISNCAGVQEIGLEMEDFADLDTASTELVACCF
jgi:hypothetical protein